MHIEQDSRFRFPQTHCKRGRNQPIITANFLTHLPFKFATKMAPICHRLQVTSALRLSRFNIPIPLKRRKSNYPETRNSWPIIPYLNHDGGEAIGLLEEHGASRLTRVHLVLEYGIRLHPRLVNWPGLGYLTIPQLGPRRVESRKISS